MFPNRTTDMGSKESKIVIQSPAQVQPKSGIKSCAIPAVKAKSNTQKTSSKNNSQNYFANTTVEPFIANQDIKQIRKKNSQFLDQYFPPKLSVQTLGLPSSSFLQDFFKANYIYSQSIESLSAKMKFERTKVISYYKGKTTNEFVLDQNGRPLRDFTNLNKNFFSSIDVFQGQIGSCYFLALVLSLTRNLDIVKHVMPLDNALHENIEKGAFHFRFWKLGSWYDLVVDDYLIVDFNHNVKLTSNKACLNEFWVCLLEKAWAKFSGSYSEIGGGGWFEDAALSLSGGIYDIYYTEIIGRKMIDPTVAGIKQSIEFYYGNVETIMPSPNELYEILSYAIGINNAISVFSFPVITFCSD